MPHKRFINVLSILLALSIVPLTVTAQDQTHFQARLEIAEQLAQSPVAPGAIGHRVFGE